MAEEMKQVNEKEATGAQETTAAAEQKNLIPDEESGNPAQPAGTEKAGSSPKWMLIISLAVLAVAVIVGGIVLARSIGEGNGNPGTSLDSSAGAQGSEEKPIQKQKNALLDSSAGAQGTEEGSTQVVTGEDATKAAAVKDSKAIETIKALSDKQLGVDKEKYDFMVAQQAYVIEGADYVQVIAAEKKENDDGTFSITPVGKYYISFDGKTILRQADDGSYEKI